MAIRPTFSKEQALLCALELSRLSGGAMILARVVPSAIEPPARFSIADAEPWLLRQRQMREAAEDYLAEIAARPDVAATQPLSYVAAGKVGPSLLALIEHEAADVLVMTTRRWRHLARWVLGSVADYLVQHAPNRS